MTFPTTFARIAAALVSFAAPSLANAASLRLDGAIVHTVSGPSLTNAPVLTEVISMDDAKKRGAVAIFEEK